MFINENHVLIVSECICYKNLILESSCYYEMDNFYVKFDLLELTARDISLLIISNKKFDHDYLRLI